MIPDPLADIGLKLYPQGLRRFLTMSMDLGSGVVSCGILTTITLVLGAVNDMSCNATPHDYQCSTTTDP